MDARTKGNGTAGLGAASDLGARSDVDSAAGLGAASDLGAPPNARGARVAAILALGARIADPNDALGQEVRSRLCETSGLSKEGVELALAEHLETSVSPQDLATFVAHAGSAPRCHIIASANVCVAALRMIALGAATAPHVFVKPSRRDPVLAEVLVRELRGDAMFRDAGGEIALVSAVNAAPGDEVHVYGADETIASVRAAQPEGVTVRGHGAGFGVAVIEAEADIEEAAERLARDVVALDQRGCLSPRIALVAEVLRPVPRAGVGVPHNASIEAKTSRSLTFGRALAAALERWAVRVPMGPQADTERHAARLYVATAQALGECFGGEGFIVGVSGAPGAPVLPPSCRAVSVMPIPVESALAHEDAIADSTSNALSAWNGKVAAIGIAGDGPLGAWVRSLFAGARVSPLGQMQKPAFDGPVDKRR